MSQIKIEIADRVVEIETIYPLINAMWHKFYTDRPADFKVSTSFSDLENEPSALFYRKEENQYNSKVESAVVHRRISEKMIDYETFMIHGAAISVDNKGILFCGKSGIGKSTHLFHWLDNCPDMSVINGDKPFVMAKDLPMLCGSPWAGKENMCNNTMVPLKAIVLLERAEDNHIEQISFANAFPTLLQQTYRPEDPAKMRKTLQLLQRLDPAVSFWRFQCNNFKADAFPTAYRALTGREP